MTTYYIRKTGSDSNAGTSANAAWATIGKALGASGMSSGDTAYVGGGFWRESVTVAMTSATVETKIIGDVDGSQTGDVGEVFFVAAQSPRASISVTPLNLAGRDYLTFENVTFCAGDNTVVNATTTPGSHHITFTNCAFYATGPTSSAIQLTGVTDTAMDWTFNRCRFHNRGVGIGITSQTSTTADYDLNVQIINCLFRGSGSSFCTFNVTGADAFKPGGIEIWNSSLEAGAGNALWAISANCSTTIPCTVYNNVILSLGLQANTSGQIIEDYNLISASTPRTNVTAGTHSVTTSYVPIMSYGHEEMFGMNPRAAWTPNEFTPWLGFGNQAGGPSVDISNLARPSGLVTITESGTATAGGAKTLTDSTKTWGTSKWTGGYTIHLTGGTGSGQTKTITSHTGTVITVDGNWITQPSTDTTYVIYFTPMSSTGTATAGGASTLTDGNAAWTTNIWATYTAEIMSGTGSGQSRVVASNTGTVLTTASAWGTNPDNTSVYNLYKGTGITDVPYAIGCMERRNAGVRDTDDEITPPNTLRLDGPGCHDFALAVNPTSTTVSVTGRFNSAYAGTKPRLVVLNGTECGVADATDTMTVAANTTETLSLTFTPSSAGIVTVRFQSLSTHVGGRAYFDDFAVS